MIDFLLWILIAFAVINAFLMTIIYIRTSKKRTDLAEKTIREELRAGRREAAEAARNLREEVAVGMKSTADTIFNTVKELGNHQRSQLEGVAKELKDLTDSNQARIEALRNTVESCLKQLQESNERKLDEMRKTVDEKLQGTLERRLGESFKIVSERLDAVHRGLGEMQSLATGVGDLKRVLTNVKTRGTWAEISLGTILDQVLTSDQYAKNVYTSDDSRESVEYAIRLPGPDGHADSCVWLPIDSKFPQEDYLRLLDAVDSADRDAIAKATTSLVRSARNSAQSIKDKYLNPPRTTDFALMFVPTEGLYAELLRQPDLVDNLQQSHRVIITGPTTLAALLNSLQMGFRTLAIEQRASEVWNVLGAVKTEFEKFGHVLDRVKNQLKTASNTIKETSVRTRAMVRKLRNVEQLPSGESANIFNLPQVENGNEDEEMDQAAGAT